MSTYQGLSLPERCGTDPTRVAHESHHGEQYDPDKCSDTPMRALLEHWIRLPPWAECRQPNLRTTGSLCQRSGRRPGERAKRQCQTRDQSGRAPMGQTTLRPWTVRTASTFVVAVTSSVVLAGCGTSAASPSMTIAGGSATLT